MSRSLLLLLAFFLSMSASRLTGQESLSADDRWGSKKGFFLARTADSRDGCSEEYKTSTVNWDYGKFDTAGDVWKVTAKRRFLADPFGGVSSESYFLERNRTCWISYDRFDQSPICSLFRSNITFDWLKRS